MPLQQPCPVCAASSVVQIKPVTIPLRKPSHLCGACGAQLVTRLSRRVWSSVAIGALLMLAIYFLYELSASIAAVPQSARALLGILAIVASYGFVASRVLRAIEFVVWSETS
jgi:hypothetical protein